MVNLSQGVNTFLAYQRKNTTWMNITNVGKYRDKKQVLIQQYKS